MFCQTWNRTHKLTFLEKLEWITLTLLLTLILSLSIPKWGYSIACGTEMHISIINEQDLLKNMATINQKTWTCEGWVLAGKWPKRLKGLFNPLVHWTSTCLERFQCPEDIGKFLVKNYLYLKIIQRQNLHQQSWTPCDSLILHTVCVTMSSHPLLQTGWET